VEDSRLLDPEWLVEIESEAIKNIPETDE